jgi:hypothetical protein
MKFLSDILARAGLVVDGAVTLNSVPNATTDTDKFLVVDSGVVKYRTGAQLLSDIGGAALATVFVTDYDYNITGTKNGTNKVFTLSGNFTSGTTRVFVNGIRYTRGASYDYTETGANQITFTNAPDAGDLITVDYIEP